MSRPFFTKEKTGHFENFDRHADLTISKLRDRLHEGVAVDLQDLFCRFTMDSASEFLLGTDVRSLSGDLPYPSTVKAATNRRAHPSDSFGNAFQKAQVATAARSRLGQFWPLAEFWENKVEKEMQTVFDYVDPIVKRALEAKMEGEGEDETLLEHLIKLTDGKCLSSPDPRSDVNSPFPPQDPTVIRDATLNVMIAGRDTVGLTKHPKDFSVVDKTPTDCCSHHVHRVYALRASSRLRSSASRGYSYRRGYESTNPGGHTQYEVPPCSAQR